MFRNQISKDAAYKYAFYAAFTVVAILMLMVGIITEEIDQRTVERYTRTDAYQDRVSYEMNLMSALERHEALDRHEERNDRLDDLISRIERLEQDLGIDPGVPE